MGEELAKPILNKKPIDGKTKLFRYGINEVQGWKKTMEVYNTKDNFLGPEKNINVFGLFEGHAGKEIAKYLSLEFTKQLLKNNNFIKGDYKQALIETFINIDASLKTESVNNKLLNYSKQNKNELRKKINDIYQKIDNKNKLNDKEINEINTFMDIIDPNNLEGVFISDYVGSSGIVILINDKITYIAKAGNSHCIAINKNLSIIKDKNIFIESKYNNNENKRIKIAKAIQYGKEKDKNYDKNEYLYTRGFGDFQYKSNSLIKLEEQEISPKPDIYEIPNEEIKFLIICNSGFFQNDININNNIKNNTIEKNIADYFIKKLQNNQKIISGIIGDYLDECISNKNDNNQDYNKNNLSCIIIDFFNN